MFERHGWQRFCCVVVVALGFFGVARGAEISLEAWRTQAENEARQDILPFWIQHTVNRENGGFYGEVSNDLVINKKADRGALLTARVLWSFSNAYIRTRDPADLQMAQWAYHDLVEHFWDDKNGGFYWTITADGKPRSMEKQTYGEAFGIYALAEYFLATHDQAALDKAVAVYRLIETHAHDPKFGGYWEVFTPDWKRDTSQYSSIIAPKASKSQNTHLHILEAYSNLLRAWPDPELRKNQFALVDVMMTKILNPQTHHLTLYQNDDWTPVGRDVSYGHDIEFSWLLVEAGEVLGDSALQKKIRDTSLAIADVTLREGVLKDGSLPYEWSPETGPYLYREWWVMAEETVGFVNAYSLSGDKKYLEAGKKSWDYIESQLIDHHFGEWFLGRTADGSIKPGPKVSIWKCPYHNSRACFEVADRLDALIKGGR